MEVDPPEASPGAKGPAEALVDRLDLALAAALDGTDGGAVQLAEFTRLAAELKALLGEGGGGGGDGGRKRGLAQELAALTAEVEAKRAAIAETEAKVDSWAERLAALLAEHEAVLGNV